MNYIAVASLSMSVIGLLMIYMAAKNIEPETVEIGEITGDLVGRTVATEGYIKSEKMHEDGHLFLTITDGKRNLQVPIFSSLMQHMDAGEFKQKARIRVTGLVDEYRGSLQVVPRKPGDIVLG